MSNIINSYIREMKKTYGFRESNAQPCPRVVVGLRCVAFRSSQRPCACEHHDHQVFDHRAMWLDSNGHHVLTSEPYGFDQAHLDEFLADHPDLPLLVHVHPEGLWFEGTTLLIFKRKP